VHGGGGIARRIAYLTEDQEWPETPVPGIVLFTDNEPPPPALAERLAG
jgi:glutamate racemase